jgi:hypothetical protein
MNPIRIFCWLLLTGVLLVPTALADGWPQKRGHGYYQAGFRLVHATRFYEPGGNRIAIPTLRDYTASLYGEYGVTDRLTATAYVPFLRRVTLNRQVGRTSGAEFFEGDAVTGVSDAEAGLRYGLWTGGPTVLSVGLKVGLPIGQDMQDNGLLTGDGEINQQLSLEAGHSFYPSPAYITASAGFNNRVKGYSDEVVYGLEGGYGLTPSFMLVGRVRGVASRKNGESGLGGMGGLFANNQQYLAYGMELRYTRREAMGVALGVEGATLAENVLSAPAFHLGLFVKR